MQTTIAIPDDDKGRDHFATGFLCGFIDGRDRGWPVNSDITAAPQWQEGYRAGHEAGLQERL